MHQRAAEPDFAGVSMTLCHCNLEVVLFASNSQEPTVDLVAHSPTGGMVSDEVATTSPCRDEFARTPPTPFFSRFSERWRRGIDGLATRNMALQLCHFNCSFSWPCPSRHRVVLHHRSLALPHWRLKLPITRNFDVRGISSLVDCYIAFFKPPSCLPAAVMSRTAQCKTSGHAPAARILRRVCEDATDMALLVTSTPADSWRFVEESNNCRLYELTGDALPSCISTVETFGAGGGGHPSEFYMVRAVTTLDADVDELLSFFKTSHTDEYQGVMKKLFGRFLDNGVTLDKLTCTTPPASAQDHDGVWSSYSVDDAYAANWLTLRSLNKLGGVDSCHDFTMMCYQDVFERHPDKSVERLGLRNGRRAVHDVMASHSLIGVHTFSSMNFSDIPELPKSSKTERLHFRNSGVVIETTNDPDSVRVSLFLSLMPNKQILKTVAASPRIRAAQTHGSSLLKKYVKWLQSLAACLGNLTEAEKPGVTIERLTKMEWVESDHCFLCLKTFRTLTMRRCHHCRFCGEAVCSSCSGFIDMSAFDVSYIERDGIDGGSRHSREEAADTRGCATCIAELQMNLSPTTHKHEIFG